MHISSGHQFPPLPPPNIYTTTPSLPLTLLRHLPPTLPPSTLHKIFTSLSSLSHRTSTLHTTTASALSSPAAEPSLRQYSAWGTRIDALTLHPAWHALKAAACAEALVADSYARGRAWLHASVRLYAFAKVLVFSPGTKVVLCPVSMTDGAARVLEVHGTAAQKAVLGRLTSGEAERAWAAGQWMTERAGGSDVSGTESVAVPVERGVPKPGDAFVLDGFKWFSSGVDGEVALALARIEGEEKLSLFLVRLRDEQGRLNGIKVHRLKDKLGTRFLPTAELELEGCKAELVGTPGEGVKCISEVLNITRIYSAAGGVAGLAYGLSLSATFAQTRMVGGTKLSELALHTHSLWRIAVLQRALMQVFFSAVGLLGKSECGVAKEEEKVLLRLYTPVLKAFTAARASEAMLGLVDSFGGQGYMEDSGLGVAEMLRDLTVERIWEGTAEVLSMDVVRVMVKSEGKALRIFADDLKKRLTGLGEETDLVKAVNELVESFESKAQEAMAALTTILSAKEGLPDYRFARPMLDLIACLHGAVLLLEQAAWSQRASSDKALAERIKICGATPSAEDDLAVARAWIEDVSDVHRTLANFTKFVDELSGHQPDNRAHENSIIFSSKL